MSRVGGGWRGAGRALLSKGEVAGLSLECNRNAWEPHSPELSVVQCG